MIFTGIQDIEDLCLVDRYAEASGTRRRLYAVPPVGRESTRLRGHEPQLSRSVQAPVWHRCRPPMNSSLYTELLVTVSTSQT